MGAGASLPEGFDGTGIGSAPHRESGRNFYAVLGLGRDASDDDIKKMYRKAAVKWHPDKWSNKPEAEKKEAEEKFKAAAEAYEVLSDQSKKALYDRYGEDGVKAGGGPPASASTGIVPMGAFPGGAVFMNGGPGVRVAFRMGGGGSGISSSRAEQIFAAFFAGGDPFAGLFDDEDDDFFRQRRRPTQPTPTPAQPPPPPPLRADLLPRDTPIKLVDLTNASLNESCGSVAGFDEAKKRYTVRLGSGKEVAVKPFNVRQIIHGARIDAATSRQHGFRDSVVGTAIYDTRSGRYEVSGLPSSAGVAHSFAVIKARPEHVILPLGTHVQAVGLTGRPELNGQIGRVVDDDGSERYVIEIAATREQMKLKFGNVVALHGHNPYVGEFG